MKSLAHLLSIDQSEASFAILVDMETLLTFAINAVLTGGALWVAGRITATPIAGNAAVLTALGASCAGLVPGFGWALSFVVLFVLLKQFTRAEVWPDLILLVVVSWGVTVLGSIFLGGLIAGVL
ncbi:MAG: hypothetical protein AAGJ86_00480 [Pseudomonadota bacterium]